MPIPCFLPKTEMSLRTSDPERWKGCGELSTKQQYRATSISPTATNIVHYNSGASLLAISSGTKQGMWFNLRLR